jgi:hypothetical protein
MIDFPRISVYRHVDLFLVAKTILVTIRRRGRCRTVDIDTLVVVVVSG